MNQLNPLLILAQDEVSFEYEASGPAALVINLIALAVFVVLIAAMWKIYAKAGKPGWASIIPIYNVIVLLEIVGRPIWWIVLMFIPLVNVVIAIILLVDLAKSFGKGGGFAMGLLFLSVIFYPILGFGDAEYQGPSVEG